MKHRKFRFAHTPAAKARDAKFLSELKAIEDSLSALERRRRTDRRTIPMTAEEMRQPWLDDYCPKCGKAISPARPLFGPWCQH